MIKLDINFRQATVHIEKTTSRDIAALCVFALAFLAGLYFWFR